MYISTEYEVSYEWIDLCGTDRFLYPNLQVAALLARKIWSLITEACGPGIRIAAPYHLFLKAYARKIIILDEWWLQFTIDESLIRTLIFLSMGMRVFKTLHGVTENCEKMIDMLALVGGLMPHISAVSQLLIFQFL